MNINKYKQMLDDEIVKLRDSLQLIGHETDDMKDDWTSKPPTEQEIDMDMLATQTEEIETNEGIIDTLEERLQEVNQALSRIENGNYGKCMVCGKEVEEQRLDADPAATTCVAHMGE